MKKETLKSYMAKAGAEPVFAKYPEEKVERVLNKRMAGMTKAHEKIIGRKPNPADVKAYVESSDKYKGDFNDGKAERVVYEHQRNK
jgi:hypothetical protein